jgi:hypothetical protein
MLKRITKIVSNNTEDNSSIDEPHGRGAGSSEEDRTSSAMNSPSDGMGSSNISAPLLQNTFHVANGDRVETDDAKKVNGAKPSLEYLAKAEALQLQLKSTVAEIQLFMASTQEHAGKTLKLKDDVFAMKEEAALACMAMMAEARAECDAMRKAAKSLCDAMRKAAKSDIDAQRKFVRELLAADRAAVETEREVLEKEKRAMEGVQQFQGSKVMLDVGGHKMSTTKQTLTSIENTFFASMFSGRFILEPDEDGYYFIDRDGKHFRHILNFLRGPSKFSHTEMSRKDQEELVVEADYYQLKDQMFPNWYLEDIGLKHLRRSLAAFNNGEMSFKDFASNVICASLLSIEIECKDINEKFQGCFMISEDVVSARPVWKMKASSDGMELLLYFISASNTFLISDEDTSTSPQPRGFLHSSSAIELEGAEVTPTQGKLTWSGSAFARRVKVVDEGGVDEDGNVWSKLSNMVVKAACSLPDSLPLLERARKILHQRTVGESLTIAEWPFSLRI